MEALKIKKFDEEEDVTEPVSPTGQYFNSSVLSVTTIAVLELEIPCDVSVTTDLENLFLPVNPRFSSIMVTDDHGVKQWRRVDVKLDDHVKVPSFPMNLPKESYDKYFDDYLTNIANGELPQHQPLWEVHIIQYPTSNAAGTIIFKLHHALGDGFSLMGALLSCCHKVGDPSMPTILPALKSNSQSNHKKRFSIGNIVNPFLSSLLNTATDFGWSLLKSTIMEDDLTPVRSGLEGLEFQPVVFSTVSFSLDRIKQIKNKVEGTVNDVITAIIFYGTRLYMQSTKKDSSNANSTAVILLNTRAISSYQTIKEVACGTKSQWGNHIACVHVPIPKAPDAEMEDPVEYLYKVKESLKKKKSSRASYLTAVFLEVISKLRGPETAARYIHGTISNASLGISNMIGPIEQIALANLPCKGIYFMSAGVPHSLRMTVMSYMGNLRVSVGTEKDFMNHKLFISCLEMAFERTFNAALAIS